MLCGNANCFHGFLPNAAFDAFEQLGIRYVELPTSLGLAMAIPELMEKQDVDRLLANLQRRNLNAITLDVYADLNREFHTEFVKRRLDFAKEIGAKYIITDATRTPLDAAGLERLYNTIRHLGDYAGNRDVIMCLDVHGGLTSSGKRCLTFMEAIRHPFVRVNYDMANIVYHNEEPIDIIEDLKLIAPYVAHVHLKDTSGGYHQWSFPALGEGTINFPEIFKVLASVRYAGPLSLEIEGVNTEDRNKHDNFEQLRRSLAYLKSIGVE
jgi:sugar phosphate isomerase/epimerase